MSQASCDAAYCLLPPIPSLPLSPLWRPSAQMPLSPKVWLSAPPVRPAPPLALIIPLFHVT